MVSKVSKSEFKAKAFEYFRLIEKSGEAIVITDRGQPVLEMRPYHAIGKEPLQLLQGSLLYCVKPTEPVGR